MIDQMSGAAMIVSFSDSARVEQYFTSDRRQLQKALAAIRPTNRSTSLAEALKVAAGLANPGRSADNTNIQDYQVAEAMPAKLIILSDGKFDDVKGFSLGNLDPVFVPIGSNRAANVGIVAFGTRTDDSQGQRLQAFAQVENFGPRQASVGLELLCDDRPIDAARVSVAPGGGQGVAFDLRGVVSGRLHLKAETGDQLAVDDEAWAVVNPPRRSMVLLVGAGNPPLETALQTGAARDAASVRIEKPAFLAGDQYRRQAAAGVYQLVIYDRCGPGTMPDANTLFIGSVPPGGGWSGKPKVKVPQIIDTDAAHPVMRWIDMSIVPQPTSISFGSRG
jgi:hypothetical protein